MKNNIWDKKFIESGNVYNIHYEFAWLTQVYSFFLSDVFSIDFIIQQ